MASYTINGLSVTPIHGDFGAEVGGVDWSQVPLPEELIRTVCPTSTCCLALKI